jgi:ABC-2 type transport system permease protein
MNNILRFRIALQTMKDNLRITIILSLLFMGMTAMYSGMYPAFKEVMLDMMESGFADSFSAFRGAEDMASYVGFLNIELYQIFWILILGMLIGFIASSIISREIEAKTIDLFMSNPVSRKQIVLEKYVGLIPMILLINVATLITVYGITLAIGEEINFGYLCATHAVSIPYFLAIAAIGLLISVIINEKMKASIIAIAIVMGMFIFESVSLLAPDYENMGLISLTHYYNPADILINGEVDVTGLVILLAFTPICLIIAMIYFEHRDIAVS